MRRPLVPRLQLSCISLQELQAQASPTPQGLGAGAAPACVPQAAAVVSEGAVAGAAGLACGQRPSHEMFAHVLAAADGTAALGDSRCVAAGQHSPIHATGAAAGRSGMGASAAADASPASSVQQSSTLTAPLLTSRRAVSPAQQELLATARQWQRSARAAAAEAEAAEDEPRAGHPPPLPSARGSCRGPAPPSLFARGGGAAAAAENACPPRSRPTPRAAAVGATPRHAAASSGGMAAFPGHKLVAARATYGQNPTFQEVKAAYNAGGRALGWRRRAPMAARSPAGRASPLAVPFYVESQSPSQVHTCVCVHVRARRLPTQPTLPPHSSRPASPRPSVQS